jgi:hypothetical protein
MAGESSTERTALKEWAVLCDALARGEIMATVRKGGIREQRAGFSVRHDRFLLYPTHFHEKRAELQPRFARRLDDGAGGERSAGTIRIAHVADVVAVWHVTELARLRSIESAHGLAWDAVASRFAYRDRPEVRVVAVRVAALPEVHEIPETRRYEGCVSWVELDAPIDVTNARSVLEGDDLRAQVAALSRALGAPERWPDLSHQQ